MATLAATGLWRPLVSEPMPDDAIVEAPSLVAPLLLKRKPCENQVQNISDHGGKSSEGKDNEDDEVQIIEPHVSNSKDVDDYVKSSYVAALTKKTSSGAILTIKNYYQSSAGQLLIGLGLSRVFEHSLDSSVKKLTHKVKKKPDDSNLVSELESARKELSRVRESNKPFKPGPKFGCPHCRFTTDFRIVYESHIEVPHTNARREYLCNFCQFKTKSADAIIMHTLQEHKRRCRVEKPLLIHRCRFCPYETNSKRSITSHVTSCAKVFPVDSFLGPQDYGESEYPGVTSKLITQDDIKAFERTRKAFLLSSYNPHQIKVTGPDAQNAQRQVLIIQGRYQPQISNHATMSSNMGGEVQFSGNPLQNFAKSRQNNRPNMSNGTNNQARLLQLVAAPNHVPRVALLQHPQTQSSFMNGKLVMNSASGIIMAPCHQSPNKSGRVPEISNNTNQARGDGYRNEEHAPSDLSEDGLDGEGGGGNSRKNLVSTQKGSTFVICEICDAYIKDLAQLRSHMQSIHEHKIHQKMLLSRPPLSCQKCQWRFYTDEGLERHLLGVHGLVTSNVQDRVDQGKDSGRCTVCGRAFASKLVAHMKDVHKTNLKLANLSYKCTVCSATFNLYGLFENHVMSVHSESVRRLSAAE